MLIISKCLLTFFVCVKYICWKNACKDSVGFLFQCITATPIESSPYSTTQPNKQTWSHLSRHILSGKWKSHFLLMHIISSSVICNYLYYCNLFVICFIFSVFTAIFNFPDTVTTHTMSCCSFLTARDALSCLTVVEIHLYWKIVSTVIYYYKIYHLLCLLL